jgi:glycosyltransferase involved in cell wall biosynthesis
MINIGIDATNITSGGGLNHLSGILNHADPVIHNFNKIFVWGSRSTLNKIIEKDCVIKRTCKQLQKNIIFRTYWQLMNLGDEVLKEKNDILFVPGGSFVTSFRPVVTMNQNLLPFDLSELKRYGFSKFAFKLMLLYMSQTYSFRKASGVIYLTEYAKTIVYSKSGNITGMSSIVPHGIESRFFREPRKQRDISTYCEKKKFRIIYISPLEPYKHHENVVQAVSKLKHKGYPVILDMYGYPSRSFVRKRLDKVMLQYDPDREFIEYHDFISYSEVHEKYLQSDVAIFASSCESFGQILLEGMASGLPTVCSDMSSMSEILGEYGVYFNPLDPISIANSLQKMIDSVEERTRCSWGGYKLSQNYSWGKCANQTFSFLNEVVEKYRNDNI